MDEIDFEKLCTKPNFIKIITSTNEQKTLYILLEYFHKVNTDTNQEFYQLFVHPICIVENFYKHKEFIPYKNSQYSPKNKFQVLIDNNQKNVKFGPIGSIMLEHNFRSFGIGTYCLSILVEILKKKFPDYSVLDGKLSFVDATSENRRRRDEFYKNIFPRVDVDEIGNGSFGADKVSDLKTHTSKRVQINEINYFNFVQKYLEFEDLVNNKEDKILKLEKNIEVYKTTNQKLKALLRISVLTISILSILFIIYYLGKN